MYFPPLDPKTWLPTCFVANMENTTNPWSKTFHISRQKQRFTAESKPEMLFQIPQNSVLQLA